MWPIRARPPWPNASSATSRSPVLTSRERAGGRAATRPVGGGGGRRALIATAAACPIQWLSLSPLMRLPHTCLILYVGRTRCATRARFPWPSASSSTLRSPVSTSGKRSAAGGRVRAREGAARARSTGLCVGGRLRALTAAASWLPARPLCLLPSLPACQSQQGERQGRYFPGQVPRAQHLAPQPRSQASAKPIHLFFIPLGPRRRRRALTAAAILSDVCACLLPARLNQVSMTGATALKQCNTSLTDLNLE